MELVMSIANAFVRIDYGKIEALREFIPELVRAGVPAQLAVSAFKAMYFDAAVKECGGNKCKAARLISTHRNTVNRYRSKGDLL
jgi:hypothetical protein